jgi:cytochrome c oxidase assembly protein subunit 11
MTAPLHQNQPIRQRASNRLIALGCAVGVASMVGLAYAAVPLYALFCQVTGYGGTTQVAVKSAPKQLGRTIAVRFDANVARKLGWRFKPVQRQITLRIGEQRLAHYRAENPTGIARTGTAVFNVTPQKAGAYFNKISCFCFTEQTLKPGQKVDMPVVFYVDPAILDDPELETVSAITLSYTFFPSDAAASPEKSAREARVLTAKE